MKAKLISIGILFIIVIGLGFTKGDGIDSFIIVLKIEIILLAAIFVLWILTLIDYFKSK